MARDDRTGTTPPEVDLELVARLRVAVARSSRQLRQRAASGMPLSLQSALVSIEQHGPLTLGELAAIEQVAPPTVTKIVTKLVDQDLVTRSPDPEDRRVSRVELAEAGAARLAESRSRRNAWLAERLGAPGAPDDAALRTTVRVLETLARPPRTGGDDA